MAHWRILLHALDRTGPPVLARSLVSWIVANRPGITLDAVAFRGGALLDDLEALVPVRVLLEPHEPWDHADPDPDRVARLRESTSGLPAADLTLLVSISAGQALGCLGSPPSPVVAWVVEQGEDLHWLDAPLRIGDRVDSWIAGSDGTRADLAGRIPGTVHVSPEFIDTPERPTPERLAAILGGSDDRPLVVGAGIGTHRKAPDLFLECAVVAARLGTTARFVWVGGETDPLVPIVRAEAARLAPDTVEFVDSTPDLTAWLAAATVFLHPARLDAFPLVCVEAAALGTPVVAFSGAGGVPEMLGETFRGEPYPDVGGLARTVVGLLGNGSGAVVGRDQQRHVLERFVAEVAASRLVDHLTALDLASVTRSASGSATR